MILGNTTRERFAMSSPMKRIDFEIRRQGINRRKMAEEVGIAYTVLSFVSNGYQPKDALAQKIADYVGWDGELHKLFDTMEEI